MKTATRRTYIVILLILAFFSGIGFMVYSFVSEGDVWVANRANAHIYSGGSLTVAGTIYDRNNNALVTTENGKRKYSLWAS